MSAAHASRRRSLGAALDCPALIPAGKPVGRNYQGNPYPFRATSHFLFLVGQPVPGAFLLVDGAHSQLFMDLPGKGDALWHGPSPSREERSQKLGIDVRPMSELKPALSQSAKKAASIPAVDGTTVLEQVALLGRELERTDQDEKLEQAMIALRLRHDDAAQAGLREAAEATVDAHRAGMAATSVGQTEHAVCAAMLDVFGRRGMGTAYGPIVSVHGEILHNHSHENICADGDLLLADVGAETQGGWAGDVTRTWPVNGTFSPTQRDIYEIVLASHEAAINKLQVGVRYRDVHLTACQTLTEGLVGLGILKGEPSSLVEQGVHALFFPHGIGHIIGLDVHDMEDLGDRAGYAPGRTRSEQFGLGYLRLDRDLEPGMAVTIEPGFYQVPAILNDPERTAFAEQALDRERLADFADVRGIRIEDDLIVTTGAPENLTGAAPKRVADVEAAVRGD